MAVRFELALRLSPLLALHPPALRLPRSRGRGENGNDRRGGDRDHRLPPSPSWPPRFQGSPSSPRRGTTPRWTRSSVARPPRRSWFLARAPPSFVASLALARALDLSIASRFLPMLDASLFLCALVLQQVRFAMGSYLRAHKSEPFAPLAVAEALAAVPLLTLAARAFGARGMILAFFGLTLLTLVPAVQIFRRCRRNWHSFQLAEREARRAV